MGNTKNLNLLRGLGADRVINYETEDFRQDSRRYHFVFDTVGNSRFRACKHLLLPGGAYLSSELGPNAENTYLPLFTRLRGGKRVLFPFPQDCKGSLQHIATVMQQGTFRAVVERSGTANTIQELFRYVMNGQKTGQVILRMQDEDQAYRGSTLQRIADA